MSKDKSKRQEVILIILASVLAAILLFGGIFYTRATRPLRQAEKEATAMAKKYTDLEEVDQFYWFTREKTYFSLTGKNKKGQQIAVIIPKDGKKITLLAQKDGITEDAAKAMVAKTYPKESVEKASLGIFEDEPVWEIVTRTSKGVNYYLIAFENGEEIKTITNV
ncbi:MULTISPECIES: cell wall elongation regulator TseB-like domain-containing protein [Enterococcus]|uniref:cell wall elongation regulator TseB-like domain-containing protein n=1 Tax=Enterococcus TaxID=1350 RepID=UPI00065DE831|nr:MULTISPECIES: DUF5590 domain-containing protein [Enterococcus]KAF1304855.1 peptidase [Enterococcus sp. JM9B]